MKTKVKLRWLALLYICFCSAQAARADGIAVLTSGSFVVGENADTYGGTFSGLLNGTTPFEVTSFGSDPGEGSLPCSFSCGGGGGERLDLRSFVGGDSFRAASVMIDGINYSLFEEGEGWRLTLEFNAGSVILPEVPAVPTVFSFEGDYDLDGGAYVPALNEDIFFISRGRVRVVIESTQTGDFRLQSATYTATAVPEPATMLLLGTGLAGIGGVIRKRRKAKTE